MSESVANEAQSVVLGVMNAANAGEASDLLDDLLMNRDRDESHLLLGIIMDAIFLYYYAYFVSLVNSRFGEAIVDCCVPQQRRSYSSG